MNVFGRAVTLLGAAYSLAPPTLHSDAPPRSDPISAKQSPAEIDVSGGVLTLAANGPAMILVRRSTFEMGSTSDEAVLATAECQRLTPGRRFVGKREGFDPCNPGQFAQEMPVHRVTLSAYWLDRTEVTVADYARCVAAARCNPLPLGDGARRFDRPNYPASLVTWDEARDYCAFRGGRLPTEAEFERAARGLGRRTFPWGNLYNSRVSNHGRFDWSDPVRMVGADPTDGRDGFVELAPVGSFPEGRTPDGFLDLAGNVSEWVADLYTPHYEEGDVEDPSLPGSENTAKTATSNSGTRVLRGGSYETWALSLRGASRQEAPPNVRHPSIGFRCAKSALTRN